LPSAFLVEVRLTEIATRLFAALDHEVEALVGPRAHRVKEIRI
jgi:hypothetical protein